MNGMKEVGTAPTPMRNNIERSSARKTNTSGSTHSKKRKGLNRPKTPISFQITTPSHKQDGTTQSQSPSSTTSATTTSQLTTLRNRLHLLTLIIRRNKNQHRSQRFFKHLCLLRASLTRLLAVHATLLTLSVSAAGPGSSSAQIRQRFEQEAALRSQREILEEHLRETLVPQCYVSFSGLVADSQFANLGVVLVSLLAEVAAGEGGVGVMRLDQREEIENVEGSGLVEAERGMKAVAGWGGLLNGTSTRATGEDWGEVVERVYDTDGDDGVGQSERTNAREEGEFGGFGDDFGPARGAGPTTALDQGVMSRNSGVDPANTNTDLNRTATSSKIESTDDATSKKKRKKKGKSAIDDLFKGLI